MKAGELMEGLKFNFLDYLRTLLRLFKSKESKIENSYIYQGPKQVFLNFFRC